MLTLKQITEQTDCVIAGLQKKHFNDAATVVAKVLDLDKQRKANQQLKDAAQAEMNRLSKQIGQLFQQGKQAKANAAKAQTGELKAQIAQYETAMQGFETEMTNILLTIPNIPVRHCSRRNGC